jgi:hypothetical protein
VPKDTKNLGDRRAAFEFPKEQIQQRIVDHWEFADDFREAFLDVQNVDPNENQIVVSQRRMAMATESAYQDIARYKNYHQKDPSNTKLDSVKRSAYLAKWMCRFKPLMVVSAIGSDPDIRDKNIDELELVNEFFCLYLFEVHLSQEVGFDIALSDRKGAELAYDLLYRGISVEGWIAIFQLIKDCCFPKFIKSTPFIEKL